MPINAFAEISSPNSIYGQEKRILFSNQLKLVQDNESSLDKIRAFIPKEEIKYSGENIVADVLIVLKIDRHIFTDLRENVSIMF
jgi:hypothetical protein